MHSLRPFIFALSVAFSFPAAAEAPGDEPACSHDAACAFRFPSSDREYLRPEWLVGLSSQALWEARNEIMARRGYAFDTPRALRFFRAKGYYRALTRNVQLSAVEKWNVDLIRAFEDGRGGAYLSGNAASPRSAVRYDVVGLDPKGDNFLSVRGGPGGKFRETGRLYTNTAVTVTEASGKWLHVHYPGGNGWSHSSYLTPSLLSPAAPRPADVQVQIVADNSRTQELRGDLSTISSQLADLSAQVAKREATTASPQAPPAPNQEVEDLRRRIADLEQRRTVATEELRSYSTPVQPENKNLQTDARRSSERYEKVPYFIPGTKTVGEMWVAPAVDNLGKPLYNLNFIDPEADYEKIAISVPITPEELAAVEKAISSIEGWSTTATEKKIRKRYEKEALCLPELQCKENGAAGLILNVVFRIEDDGSTATILRTRQGKFERTFGFSMESAALLRNYLQHVAVAGAAEFEAGTATKEDLDDMFR